MPKPSQCEGCPLYKTGRGFVLGSGNPRTCKFSIMLEAPDSNELDERPDKLELDTRQRDYPSLDLPSLAKGVPAVGRAGQVLNTWLLRALNISRSEVFVDNILRCLPPKNKQGAAYPVGDERKQAEAHCRVYDRWSLAKPTVGIVTLHPSALLRETTPMPLVLADLKKTLDFARDGQRPILLMGGKAASYWLGQETNVTAWRGHYLVETTGAAMHRAQRLV